MGGRGRIGCATGAGLAVTLLVVGTLRLITGVPIGAEDNGDGYRMFCGVGLRPLTLDGLAAWKGGVVGDFAVGDPSCGMSVPSSAALMLRVAHAVGLGGSLSLVTLAWCYAVLAGVVVGLATWAASARGPWRAAVLAVPVAPLALPSFSRFFASTYGEPAGLLGTLAVACGVAVLLVVGPGRRRERLLGLALVLGGGGLAATAKPGFVPVLLVALVVAAVAILRAPRGTLPWPASRPGRAVVVAATAAALAAVVVPVAGATHFQKSIYEGANVHDVVFTMALPELGPDAATELDLPVAGAAAISGHGFFNGPPRPTDAWWQQAIGERPGQLRTDAVLALAREPAALMRTAGVGLQATTRADLPYLADAPADPSRPTATAGDVGWSGGRGPELRAVLADTDRPPWLPSVVVLLALAAAVSSPAWRTRARAAGRWCVAAGIGAATTLALVAAALVGDGYFELFKHVWLAAAVLLVTALCLAAGLVAALASTLRRPPCVTATSVADLPETVEECARGRRRPPVVVAALALGLLAGCATGTGGPTDPSTPREPCALPADAPGSTAPPGAEEPGVPGAPEVATGYRSGLAEVRTRTYAVATANPLATRAACELLRDGGTAADAAVVAQTVLGLVEPQSSGIGGGGFLLHHDAATGRVQAYDGRETAPAAADGEYLRRVSAGDPTPPRPDARASGRSIGVPGVVRMLELVHREHGRTPWRDLFAPAVRLANDGFAISPRLAASIADSRAGLAADPPAAAYLLRPDSSPRTAGEVLRNPDLAATMTALADRGADALHTGPLAAAIVAAARDGAGGRTPSLLTAEDLAAYRPVEREAVCAPYGPHQVCGMPPPSSGGLTVGAALGILDELGVEVEKPEPAGPDGAVPTAAGAHLIAEAERLAYADRDRYVADTDFVPLPGSPGALLDPAYLASRAALVDRGRSMGTAQPGNLGPVPRGSRPEGPENGTSHVSVVDRYGDAAAFTTSVESSFGSFHAVGGFLLNNQLTDFSAAPLDPAGVPMANRVQPGKRPRSSMAPTLVYDAGPDGRRGALTAVTGSPGGAQIPQFVVKTLVHALDWGAGPQAAVSAIDLGAVNAPSTGVGGEHPDVASGRATALVDGLRQRGHQVSTAAQSSGLSMIVRTPDGWAGGADPRREGVVLGDTGG